MKRPPNTHLQLLLEHVQDVLLHGTLRLSSSVDDPDDDEEDECVPRRLAQSALQFAVVAGEEHGLAEHAQTDRGLESGGFGGTLEMKPRMRRDDDRLRIVRVLELLELGLDVGRRVLTCFENEALRLDRAVEPAGCLEL